MGGSAEYPGLEWWGAHFPKDWCWEEDATSKAFLNIRKRSFAVEDFKGPWSRGLCLFDQSKKKSWISSVIDWHGFAWDCLLDFVKVTSGEDRKNLDHAVDADFENKNQIDWFRQYMIYLTNVKAVPINSSRHLYRLVGVVADVFRVQ